MRGEFTPVTTTALRLAVQLQRLGRGRPRMESGGVGGRLNRDARREHRIRDSPGDLDHRLAANLMRRASPVDPRIAEAVEDPDAAGMDKCRVALGRGA